MEKVQLGTPDGTVENIDRIAEVFPQVITEIEGENGRIERAVDFDALRDLLEDVAEGNRERYQFTWPGKAEAKAEARRPIGKTMRPVLEKSVGWDTTENLYIEGDNLDALKLLKETYAGKVKLIYIDPPYNTGHDFVYDDDFARSRGEYDLESGEYDEDGGRLVANTESNGRFHSDWCSMIYPRLILARDLLKRDGVIFISLDDSELPNLRFICDEIFGNRNFVADIIWQKKFSRANDARYFSTMHDHILCYCKQEYDKITNTGWKIGLLPRGSELPAGYSNPDNDARGPWTSVILSAKSGSDKFLYEITAPGGAVYTPPSGRFWCCSKTTFSEWDKDGRIWWGKDGNSSPRKKTFLSEVQDGLRPNSILLQSEVGTNQEGKQELKRLFDGVGVFDGPKPVKLLKTLGLIANLSDGDMILDFFSGSSTLAHAAMELSKESGDCYPFIMVQIPEAVDSCSEAGKAGYLTICELGEERIRRAGKMIAAKIDKTDRRHEPDANPKPNPDLGFRVLAIDSSNMKNAYFTPEETVQERLLDVVDNLKEGRTGFDLLFEILPKFRIPYSAKIEERELCGKQCFIVNDNQLIACFDVNVGVDTIEAIAKLEPVYAVMRDASMVDDATQANFEELFKTYSPDTVRRVI